VRLRFAGPAIGADPGADGFTPAQRVSLAEGPAHFGQGTIGPGRAIELERGFAAPTAAQQLASVPISGGFEPVQHHGGQLYVQWP
jgi:hypothetical protein